MKNFKQEWIDNHPEYPSAALKNLWAKAWVSAENVAVGETLTVKNYGGGPMGVKGTIKSATPHRLKFRGRSVVVVYRVVLECGILADVPKVEKTVHISRLPTRR